MADDLARAQRALAEQNRNEALDALLAAWRACRAPELEALIDAVSIDAARAWPPLPDDRAGYDAAWHAREKEVGAAGLAHLLPGLMADPRGAIPLRLRKLIDRGPDPRVGAMLLEMIDAPPVTASSNAPMWTLLFSALPGVVDARATRRLQARAKKKGGDSQFWSKLTAWVSAAIPKLPPPAALPAAQVKAVAALTKAASALAKAPAPEAQAPKVAAPARPLPVLKTLAQAIDALKAKQGAGALDALLSVWEGTRAPEVAALVERLGHALAQTQAPITGTPAAVHAQWMKLGKEGRPAHVNRLIDALLVGKLADSEERMAVMLDWAPDPRVATKLALLIESSIGARPVLWKLCYELVVRHADPRIRTVIAARVNHLQTAPLFDRNRAEGPHARRAHEPFLAVCAQARPLSEPERAALKQADGLVDALTPKADTHREEQLLRAIADDFAADAPRQVYADFLSEQGDPRGEYIALAIASEQPGAKLKGKLAAAYKACRQQLLGPLAPLVCFSTVFERGLLHTYEVRDQHVSWAPGPALDALLTDARWAQVHTLKFWGFDHSSPNLEQILARAPLYSLRRLAGVGLSGLAVVARRAFPWKLEALALHNWPEGDFGAVPPLPTLRTLEVADFRLPPPERLRAPVFAALEVVRVGHPDYGGAVDLGGWLTQVASLRLKQFELSCASVGCSATGRDVAFSVGARCKADQQDFLDALQSLKDVPRGLLGQVTWRSAAADPAVDAKAEAAFAHFGATKA